jgi:hypothetical protein
MVGTYRCKPRFENPETFIEVKEKGDKFSVTHFFKSGVIAKEEWSKKDFKELKSTLTKVTDIKWKKQQEGDEVCKKIITKKKVLSKKKVVSKKLAAKK